MNICHKPKEVNVCGSEEIMLRRQINTVARRTHHALGSGASNILINDLANGLHD